MKFRRYIMIIGAIYLFQGCQYLSDGKYCTVGVVATINDCLPQVVSIKNPQFPQCEISLQTGEKGYVYEPVKIGDVVELCDGITSTINPYHAETSN